MTHKSDQAVRLQFKLAEITDLELEEVLTLALVQNCIAGIRGKAIFGLAPEMLAVASTENEATIPVNALSMNVYTAFDGLNDAEKAHHVQVLKSQIQFQWMKLHENIKLKHLLQMTPPERRLCRSNKIPFDSYRWKQLLRNVAKLCKPCNLEAFVNTGFLQQEALPLQLIYTDTTPSVFELRVSLGPVPAELNKVNVYKSLLMHNHCCGDESGIWWGVHPTGDHVVMVIEHQLSTSANFFSPPSEHDMFDLMKNTTAQSGKLWETMLKGIKHIESFRH